jgi:hypothetical protein
MREVAMRRFNYAVFGILLCAGLSPAAHAADESPARAGTWTLNNWTPGKTVHLTLSYRSGTTQWQWGNDQPIADLHGLSPDQLHAAHADVGFTLQRDAGTFGFQGAITLGLGRGEFRFIPDPTYVAALAALGYGPVEDDGMVTMLLAVRDVSIAYAAEVKGSGLKGVTVSDLVRFQDHGVGLPLIHAVAEIGYAGLTADDLVRFRDHGVDAESLRALKASGAPELRADEIIRLHDHGVRPEYLARIRSAGYPDFTVDQIIRLYEHGVN